MSDDMNRILITADLNRGLSIGEINKTIKSIEKNSSLKAIRLKVDVDQNILKTLKEFNKNISNVNQSIGQQSNATKDAAKASKSATSAIQQETQALRQQNTELEKNERLKTKVTTFDNHLGGQSVRTDSTVGDAYRRKTTSETLMYKPDGGFAGKANNPTVEAFSHEKLREAEKNLERFTENSNARLKELRKQIGNLNPEVKALTKEVGELNTHSSKGDFDKVNDKFKNLEIKAKEATKGFKEMDEALSNIGKKTSEAEIQDISKRAELSQKAKLKEYEDSVKLSEQQAKIQKGYVQDIDRAHHDAFLEKEKRESHLGNKMVQDRVRAYDQAIIQDNKFNQKRFVNEQKFARMQQDTLNKIETARMKFGHNKGVNEKLDGLMFNAQNIKSTEDFNNKLRDVNTTIGKTTIGMKAARVSTLGLGEAFSTALIKFPVWMAATTVFFGTIRGMQAAVQTIIQVDTQMTQLKRVMNESTNFESMLRDSIGLANELGRSIGEINENMIGFARMGFNEEQTLSLAKTATLFQNISELTPDEAVDTMTAAMTIFNIKANESIKIADKLNEIDNNFAITSRDLALGLTKAGSAANTFGVSLEKLLGDTTAITTATRESGAVVGNSLKTIYSRLTTMDKSEEVLNAVGVAMRDVGGQTRDVSDILDDLAGKWSGLTNEQQQNTAVQLAGRYQLTRFLALMQQYDISVKATEAAINSQGSANRENEKYMQSLQARTEKMKVAWQEFALTMGEAGITDAIIAITSSLTSLADILGFVVNNVGLLPPVLGVAAAAFLTFSNKGKEAIKSLLASIKSLPSHINSFKDVDSFKSILANMIPQKLEAPEIDTLKARQSFADFGGWVTDNNKRVLKSIASQRLEIERQLKTMPFDKLVKNLDPLLNKYDSLGKKAQNLRTTSTVAMTAIGATARTAAIGVTVLGRAFVVAGVALKAFALSMATMAVYTAAFTALGWVVGKVIGEFQKAGNAAKETAERLKNLTEEYKSSVTEINEKIDGLKKLSIEYDTLKSKTDKTIEDTERLNEIERDLVATYGVTATAIDAQGVAYTNGNKLIEARIALLQKQKEEEAEALYHTVLGAETDTQKIIEKDIGNIEKKEQKLQDLYEKQKKFNSLVDSGSVIKAEGDFRDIKRVTGGSHINTGSTNAHQLELVKKYRESIEAEIGKTLSEMPTLTTKLYEDAQNRLTVYANHVSDTGAQLSEEVRALVLEIAKAYSITPSRSIESSLKNIDSLINNALKEDGLQSLIDNYNELVKTGEDSKGIEQASVAISEFVDGYNNLNTLSSSGQKGVVEFREVFKSMYPPIVNLTSAAKNTYPVFNELDQHLGNITDEADGAAKGFINLKREFDEHDEFIGFTGTIANATEKIEELQKKFDGLTGEIKSLNKVIYDLNDGQSLSSDAIADLILKYPQLATQVEKTTDGYRISSDALEVLRQVKIKEAQDSIASQIQSTKATLLNTSQRIKAYGLELDAIDSLDSAHKQASKLGFVKMFGDTAFEDIKFDDIKNQITVGDSVTNWSKQEYQKVKESFEEQKATNNSLIEIGNLYESSKTLMEMINDPYFGVSSSKDKSKDKDKDLAKLQDITDSRINAINSLAGAQNKLNEIMKSGISSDDTYSTQIKKTTELLSGQSKELGLLKDAQMGLITEQNKVQTSNSKYDMSSWVDSNGQATESFVKLYNSMKSGTAQANLQAIFDQYRKYDDAIRVNKSNISSLIETQEKEKKILDDLKLSYTQNYLDKRNKDIEKYNDQLKKAQQRQSLMTEDGANWRKEQEKQIQILTDKKNALHEENNWIRERLEQNKKAQASEKLTAAQLEVLNKQLEANSDAWYETVNAINASTKALADQREKYVDKIIADYKKMLEQTRDLELSAIDARDKAEDERHKNVMDNYKRELDSFKKIIDAQIQAMDRLNASEDYDREINKLLEEESKIQNKINTISQDDSFEGKAKRKELGEQLAAVQEEIENKQRDRGRTIQREALEDLLEDREEHISNLEDLEDKKHKGLKKSLDDEKEATKRHWDSILNNEKKYYDLKQDLMSNDASLVQSTLDALRLGYDGFFAYLLTQAESLKEMFSTINSNTQIDYEYLNGFPVKSENGSTSSVGSSKPSQGTPLNKSSDWKEYLENKKKAEEIKSPSDPEFQKLRAKNDALRAKWGFQDGSYNDLKDIKVYHTGGEVGVEGTTTKKWWDKILKSNEIPAILKKGEVVLDSPMQFINDIANRMMSGLTNLTPKTSMATSSGSSGTNIENINVTLQGVVKDGEDFADKFVGGLNRKGIRIGRRN